MITKSPDKTHAKPFLIVEERLLSLPKMLRVMAHVHALSRSLEKLQHLKDPCQQKKWKCPEWNGSAQNCKTSTVLKLSMEQSQSRKKFPKIQLNPRLDTDGIVRCYGRLRNANLSEKTITPIPFPKRESFVQLFVEDFHK